MTLDKIDKLFRIADSVNEYLLKNATVKFNSDVEFNEVIDFSISSNLLSLCASRYSALSHKANDYTKSDYLLIRNLIEYLALIAYNNKKSLNEKEIILFKIQYIFLEKNIYENKDFFSLIFNEEQLAKDLKTVNELMSKYEITDEDISNLTKYNFSFINYSSPFNLIKDYAPEFQKFYEKISIIIHPTYCLDYNQFDIATDKMLDYMFDILLDRYNNVHESRESLGLKFAKIFDDRYYLSNSPHNRIQTELNKFNQLLIEYSGLLNNSDSFLVVIVDIISQLSSMCLDFNFAIYETLKIKFKCYVETIAYLYVLLKNGLVTDSSNDLSNLVKLISIIDFNNDLLEDEEMYNMFVQLYYKVFNENLSKEDIKKFINKKLPIINSFDKEITSYSSLVKKVMMKLYSNEFHKFSAKEITAIRKEGQKQLLKEDMFKIKDYLIMSYFESQNLSHGTGYLFFSNTGAFSIDTTLLLYIFDMTYKLIDTYVEKNIHHTKISKMQKFRYDINKCIKKLRIVINEPKVLSKGLL